jgi:hypothetical protein
MDRLVVEAQFQEVKQKYVALDLVQSDPDHFLIAGVLRFAAQFEERLLEDEYQITISIPEDYPRSPPQAFEVGGRIPKTYHHYSNESLCLGARFIVRQTFQHRPTLIGFVEDLLIPYLYRYTYLSQNGAEPYGELSHGWAGIVESYKELFQIDSPRAILGLLKTLADHSYRGHLTCPCGSNKRLRNCHGNTLRKMMCVQSAEEYERDYREIVEGAKEFQKR